MSVVAIAEWAILHDADDSEVRRLERCGVQDYVSRRLTEKMRQSRLARRVDTPDDLVAATLDLLGTNLDEQQLLHLRDDLRRLEGHVLTRAPASRFDWWEILIALKEAGMPQDRLREEWLARFTSLLLRINRAPPVLRHLPDPDPVQIKARYPVPACGYGPWVEAERKFYFRFQRTFAGAVGAFVGALWHHAHQSVQARRGWPDMTPADYEAAVFATAHASLDGEGPGWLVPAAGGTAAAIQAHRAIRLRYLVRRVLTLADKKRISGRVLPWAERVFRAAYHTLHGGLISQSELTSLESAKPRLTEKKPKPGLSPADAAVRSLHARLTSAPDRPSGVRAPVSNLPDLVVDIASTVGRPDDDDAVLSAMGSYLRQAAIVPSEDGVRRILGAALGDQIASFHVMEVVRARLAVYRMGVTRKQQAATLLGQ